MRITCPHCGVRDAQEFTYLGDAVLTNRPRTPVEQPIDDKVLDTWHEYVHLRDNPYGEHRELWYHGGGCHQWLVLTRNVRTHEIAAPAAAAATSKVSS